jgi:hypothetical protein
MADFLCDSFTKVYVVASDPSSVTSASTLERSILVQRIVRHGFDRYYIFQLKFLAQYPVRAAR